MRYSFKFKVESDDNFGVFVFFNFNNRIRRIDVI